MLLFHLWGGPQEGGGVAHGQAQGQDTVAFVTKPTRLEDTKGGVEVILLRSHPTWHWPTHAKGVECKSGIEQYLAEAADRRVSQERDWTAPTTAIISMLGIQRRDSR